MKTRPCCCTLPLSQSQPNMNTVWQVFNYLPMFPHATWTKGGSHCVIWLSAALLSCAEKCKHNSKWSVYFCSLGWGGGTSAGAPGLSPLNGKCLGNHTRHVRWVHFSQCLCSISLYITYTVYVSWFISIPDFFIKYFAPTESPAVSWLWCNYKLQGSVKHRPRRD